MFKEYYAKLLKQLSIDYNCTPAQLCARENSVTVSALNEGRRSYSPGRPFLQMVTLGAGTVVSADECLHEFLRGFVKDVEGHRLFEFGKLAELNEELKQYGCRIKSTHHMFLPYRDVEPDSARRLFQPYRDGGQDSAPRMFQPYRDGGQEEFCQVKWLYDGEITPFYGDPRFRNAIAYPEPCPARPDRIAVLTVDGDTIMGMAGCSEDAPHWQQIGIDVLPEYRSRGIGAYLVTLLKNRIIEMGDTPFYGTAPANMHSQNIALNSGFKHAWVETEAVKADGNGDE